MAHRRKQKRETKYTKKCYRHNLPNLTESIVKDNGKLAVVRYCPLCRSEQEELEKAQLETELKTGLETEVSQTEVEEKFVSDMDGVDENSHQEGFI